MKFIPNEIYQKFILRIKSVESLLKKEKSIVVAVSGGPDSMFLLLLLYNFSIKNKLKLIPVYINHKVRTQKEIEKDIQTIKLFCKDKNLELIVKEISAEKKDEETLRELRYKKLFEVAKKFSTKLIATAHTLDDVVETFFLNLLRGTGIKGLCSIPAIREEKFQNSTFYIIRPIIDISKNELLDVLKQQKIKYTIDRTNKEILYKRNLFRNKISPLLFKINTNYKSNILKTIELLQQTYNFIDEIILEKAYSVIKTKKDEVRIDLKKFLMYNNFIKRELLHRVLSDVAIRHKLRFKQGYKATIEKILSFINNLKEKELFVNKNLNLIKVRNTLKLKINK